MGIKLVYFQGSRFLSWPQVSDIRSTAPTLTSNHVLLVIAGQGQYRTLQEFIRVISDPQTIQVSSGYIGFVFCSESQVRQICPALPLSSLIQIHLLVAYVLIDNQESY